MDKQASKIVVVTGGAMGIGASLVSMLAGDGHRVVIADIAEEQGVRLAGQIEQAGGRACYVHADISRTADAANLIHVAVETFGGLDWLVNNAGIVISKSTMELREEEWDRVLDINLK